MYTSITRSVASNTARAFSTDEKYSLHAANDVLDMAQAHRTVPVPKGAARRGHSDALRAPHGEGCGGHGGWRLPLPVPHPPGASGCAAPRSASTHSVCGPA